MSTQNKGQSPLVRLFPLLGHKNINIRREILAGITTFLTMSYIIAVNPSILADAGMDAGALVTATCLAAAAGCFLMGLLADLPFALASGMGLNAFFAYTVVLKMHISWQLALTAVFFEGIIFIFLSLFKVREAVANSIPLNMKYAVTGGIGLFIAFIGFTGSGFVVANEATFVSLGHFHLPTIIAAIGVIVIAILDKKGMRGSILVGIALCSAIAWIFALQDPKAAADMGIYLPQGLLKFESIAPVAGQLDFSLFTSWKNFQLLFIVVVTFLFVDFFDTIGTLVGVSSRADMLDEKGHVPRVGRALMSDALATTLGAALGVSTVTTYVESATGVSAGGRTGVTAMTTGCLFLIAMFFSPVFIAIPACATAPALIYVGYLMLTSVKGIDFSNITEGIPAFITIAAMPLTYSIGDGLTLGVIAYVVINLGYNAIAKKENREPVSWVMICLAILFIAKLWFTA